MSEKMSRGPGRPPIDGKRALFILESRQIEMLDEIRKDGISKSDFVRDALDRAFERREAEKSDG